MIGNKGKHSYTTDCDNFSAKTKLRIPEGNDNPKWCFVCGKVVLTESAVTWAILFAFKMWTLNMAQGASMCAGRDAGPIGGGGKNKKPTDQMLCFPDAILFGLNYPRFGNECTRNWENRILHNPVEKRKSPNIAQHPVVIFFCFYNLKKICITVWYL